LLLLTWWCIAYLVVYCILFNAGISEDMLILLFMASPFLLIWLAVTILKDRQYPTSELREKEEWGYRDRDRDSLGTF
jgi:hypothetical protein